MENMLNEIDQIIIDDEMATLDNEDSSILLEEDSEILPFELRERILQGEYL